MYREHNGHDIPPNSMISRRIMTVVDNVLSLISNYLEHILNCIVQHETEVLFNITDQLTIPKQCQIKLLLVFL